MPQTYCVHWFSQEDSGYVGRFPSWEAATQAGDDFVAEQYFTDPLAAEGDYDFVVEDAKEAYLRDEFDAAPDMLDHVTLTLEEAGIL